jgi:hypothetical protein
LKITHAKKYYRLNTLNLTYFIINSKIDLNLFPVHIHCTYAA